jgi:hypothetical protein
MPIPVVGRSGSRLDLIVSAKEDYSRPHSLPFSTPHPGPKTSLVSNRHNNVSGRRTSCDRMAIAGVYDDLDYTPF